MPKNTPQEFRALPMQTSLKSNCLSKSPHKQEPSPAIILLIIIQKATILQQR